jgi:hypothetical protein
MDDQEKNGRDEEALEALREARRQILEQNRERGRAVERLVEEKILKHVENYEREVTVPGRRLDFEIRSKDGELIAVGEIKSGSIKDAEQIKDQIDQAEQSKTQTYILAHTDPEKALEFLEKHPDVLEYAMNKGVNFIIKDLSVFERQESIREEKDETKDEKKDEKLEDYIGVITEKEKEGEETSQTEVQREEDTVARRETQEDARPEPQAKDEPPPEDNERPEEDSESSRKPAQESEPRTGDSDEGTPATDEEVEDEDQDEGREAPKVEDWAVDEGTHRQDESEPSSEETGVEEKEASAEEGEPPATENGKAAQEFDEQQLTVDELQGPDTETEQPAEALEEPALTAESPTADEMLFSVDEPGAEMVDAAKLNEQLRIELSVLRDSQDDEKEEATSDWQIE